MNYKKEESWGRFDILGISKYLSMFSITLTFLAFGLILTKGFNYGVDFAGGIETQIQFGQDVEAGRVRSFMGKAGFPNASVQALGGTSREFLIRTELVQGKTEEETNKLTAATVEGLKQSLLQEFQAESPVVRRIDTVGPQIGAELRRNGALAGFYCLILILVYVGLRFDYRYSPGAVFCLFHDAIITLGIFSLLGWEVNTQTMAAILTLIGYSLNDTIVIFDRIRENITIWRGKPIYWIANRSLNEMLGRTILTYVTTTFTVFAMLIFADGVIRDFALTMAIGMALGVYSTVYIATPLVLVMDKYQQWRRVQQLQTAKA